MAETTITSIPKKIWEILKQKGKLKSSNIHMLQISQKFY